jgi:hypothetical protein
VNLNNFESYSDKKILARGSDYYENDHVISVEETEDNVFEAEVEGTELYIVEVELDDKANIVDSQCDCPYDMGEYCKHQVAVFFALRKRKNSTDQAAILKSQVPKKRKAPDMKKILSERTKDELIEFLLTIASEYEEIKQRLLLNFTDGNDQKEISQSITLIRTFIDNNADRYGFVAYGDTYEAVKGAGLVLEKARSAFKKNKIMHALELILCIIHEMMDLLGNTDDSDGIVSGEIEESLAFVKELIRNEGLSSVDKENIFHKLIEEASNRRYDDWTDWRLELLGSCSELADTPVLRKQLENHLVAMLSNKKEDSWSAGYFAERVNLIRYHMVEQYDGPKKAQEFIQQNLQYSGFREMAVVSAMKEKDYESVIKLTLDGEKKDKGMRGLVHQWKEYRYKACQLSGKLDEQRGIAMEFILDGSFEYYKALKETYDSSEWLSVYPKIISLLENRNITNQDVYTRILIEEGEKRKLLEHVKGRPAMVEKFFKQLIPEFKEEVYTLFLQHIEQTAARAGNRKDYQGVCAVIRNLKKAGGREQALKIKQNLINRYTNRPAFRDELSKV